MYNSSMIDEVKKQVTSTRILIALLIIAVSLYLFQLFWGFFQGFSDIFVMLITSWLLSFVLEPLVNGVQKYTKSPRLLAASIVFLAFLGFLVVTVFQFIPVVTSQTHSLVTVLPKYVSSAPPFMKKWVAFATGYLDNSLPIISSIATFLFDAFLVFVISFYFILDKEKGKKELYRLTPTQWHPNITYLQGLIDQVFASFIRVQILYAIIGGLTTWLVLRAFNVEFAASTALFSGVLSIIPLIGPLLALIPPLLIPMLTDTTQAVFIFITLLIIQQITFNIIGPKLLGKAFKIHPVIVLISFVIGYKIAGVAGAIFVVPFLGIGTVLLHQLHSHFMESVNKTSH